MKARLARLDRIALGCLALLPFLWYFTPIFTEACYYLGDLMAQYNPWWSYSHASLQEGRFPLWNPYVLGGMPHHVNPENSLFYPLKLPLIFLSFFKAAALLRALNAIVASTGFFLLLRSYRTRPLSAAVGALMFSYGSFMAYEFIHIPYINTAVWFPWQLIFLNRLGRRPDLRTALLLAIVTALSFLGGSPGIFLTCQFTLSFFLGAALLRLALAGRWSRLARMLGLLALSVLLVIALTLVLLLPAFQFIWHSPRAEGLSDPANLSTFSMIPEALQALLFPWLHLDFGAPYPPIYPIFFLNVPFVSFGAVLLALFNLRSRRYAQLMPVALAVVLFSVLMALGTRTAFFPWMLEHAVIFRWFRWPHDYLLMTYLVLALTAATGFDALWRERGGRAKRFGPIALLYALVGFIWVPHWSSLVVLATFAALVGCALLPALRSWARDLPAWSRSAGGALLLTLLAAELCAYSYNFRIYLPRQELELRHAQEALEWVKSQNPIDRVAVAAPAGRTYFSGRERFFSKHLALVESLPEGNRSLTDFDNWLRQARAPELAERLWQRRAAFHDLDDIHWAYPVNASMIFRYQEISGYNPFALERVRRLFRTLPIQRTWDLFGVQHVITAHGVVHDTLQPVHSAGSLKVYRNTQALPRVVVPLRVRGPVDADEILEQLRSEKFDATQAALLEQALPPGLAGAPGSARISAYEPEQVTILADMQQAGLVVLHDVYHPDWKVYVDGKQSSVLRANYLFRAVQVPAGSHEIRFSYSPDSFFLSAWISGFGWAACLLALALIRRKWQRAR